MKQKSKKILLYALKPRTILLFVALCNFLWYYSLSRSVQQSGSDAITFCISCGWYWDGADAAKPFFLLVAVLFMLADRWWGYLITAVISGYLTIEGIIWVSRGTSFSGGISERIELISNRAGLALWQFLDWQYVLALIVLIIALGYLIFSIVGTKQNKVDPG